jgi:hypothetical protein
VGNTLKYSHQIEEVSMTPKNLQHIAGNMGSRDNLPQYTLHNRME